MRSAMNILDRVSSRVSPTPREMKKEDDAQRLGDEILSARGSQTFN